MSGLLDLVVLWSRWRGRRSARTATTQDQRLATADQTTPADGIASPLHPLVRWRGNEVER